VLLLAWSVVAPGKIINGAPDPLPAHPWQTSDRILHAQKTIARPATERPLQAKRFTEPRIVRIALGYPSRKGDRDRGHAAAER